jgi:trimeric autotransporter adhesin
MKPFFYNLISLSFFAFSAHAQVNIQTVAGDGNTSFSGDSGAATNAQLYRPYGVCTDVVGNTYISDAGNNRIRKIDLSGNITTIAGTGASGYTGDGGAATNAALSYPNGISVDGSGNIYFADNGNNVIREVIASSGIIVTIAGNGSGGYAGDGAAATAASLYGPVSLALDAAGNLYIADKFNNRVREVVASSGFITTVAGNGTAGYAGDSSVATAAELLFPTGVAVDAAGNIFIADFENSVIRKVIASSGNIYTVAGNGSYGYSGDGGAATGAQLNNPVAVAVDSAGDFFIADGNDVIRKVAASSGIIATVAGDSIAGYSGDGGAATAAEINFPRGVFADNEGSLLIADYNNNRIRSVSTSGVIGTVAGTGLYSFSGDGATALRAELNDNEGVAADTAGNLYIADKLNNRIRKVDAATGMIATIAGNGIAGHIGDGGSALSASLNQPTDICLDSIGNLYIADAMNHVIRKVDATNNIYTIAGTGVGGYSGDGGPATTAMLNHPSGVCMDHMHHLYISDQANSRVRMLDFSTGQIETVAGTGVAGFSGDGGAATAAKLNTPTRMCIDDGNNLYIADEAENRVRKLYSSGKITTIAGSGTAGYGGDAGAATAAVLNGPDGVCVSGAGDLYIADKNNNVVRMVDPSGNIHTIAGDDTAGYSGDGGPATAAMLNGPAAITAYPSGRLLIADAGNSRVRLLSGLPTSASTLIVSTPSFAVYPNPCHDRVVISCPPVNGGTLAIYDISGKKYIESMLTGSVAIDVSRLAPGLYLVELTQSGGKQSARRLVVY